MDKYLVSFTSLNGVHIEEYTYGTSYYDAAVSVCKTKHLVQFHTGKNKKCFIATRHGQVTVTVIKIKEVHT